MLRDQENLREILKYLRISVVTEASGVSKQIISMFMRNKDKTLSYKTILRLNKFLDGYVESLAEKDIDSLRRNLWCLKTSFIIEKTNLTRQTIMAFLNGKECKNSTIKLLNFALDAYMEIIK